MAAIGKLLDFYELKAAKIYALTSDGAALNYGTGIAIPGIMTLNISPGDVRHIKILGDNKIRRIAGHPLSYKIKVKHSASNWDAFAALMGGTASTAGTTPNTTSSYTAKGADQFGIVKIAGLIANAKDAGSPNGANGILTLFKCTISTALSFNVDDKATEWDWEAEAIPTDFNDNLWDVTAYETAATLPT